MIHKCSQTRSLSLKLIVQVAKLSCVPLVSTCTPHIPVLRLLEAQDRLIILFVMHVATPSCPPSSLLSGDADATHQSLDITTQSKVQPYLQHTLTGAGTKAGIQVEPWHDSNTCMKLSILFCFYSASQHSFGLWSLPLSQSPVTVWGSTEYGQCSQQAVRKRLPCFKVEERVWPWGKHCQCLHLPAQLCCFHLCCADMVAEFLW